MRILNLFLAMVLCTGLAMAQNTEPYLVKDFSGQRINRLEVSTSGGSIKVNGGTSTPKVKVFIRSNSWNTKLSQKEIEERLENYILEVKVSGNTLICTAKPKKENFSWNNSNRLSIGFEIDSPGKVDTDLATSGGSITLSDLDGNLGFKTSGGSMDLNDLKGNIKGSTSGGSIKMNELSGDISLSTSGGSITAENSDGKIKLTTSGGSLTFNNLKGDIKGTTSGGSIRANNVNGDLNISTSGGSIKFTNIEGNLSGSTSGGGIEGNILAIRDHVSLSTSAGSIKVDLPFNEGMDLDLKGNRVYSDKLAKVSNTLKEGKVNGRVNGGGKSVKMRTSAGSIYVD
ncbi:MAG: hypothetical protein KF870_12215 [Leadbetterella sp.]|nr:hypothetical protein [Leadbetterella sp.]